MTNAQLHSIEESGFLATVAIDAAEEQSVGVDTVDRIHARQAKSWSRFARDHSPEGDGPCTE